MMRFKKFGCLSGVLTCAIAFSVQAQEALPPTVTLPVQQATDSQVSSGNQAVTRPTEPLAESTLPLTEDSSDFSVQTNTAIDLSFYYENSNNTFSTDGTDNRDSEPSSYLNINLDHKFSSLFSGYLQLGLPLSDSDAAVDVSEFYLHFDLSNEQLTRNITAGTQSVFDDRGWFYDSTLDLVRANFSTDVWSLTVGAGAQTSNAFLSDFFEPHEDKLMQWIGEYSYQINSSHKLSFVLTGLKDKSAVSDDIQSDLTWLGARANGQVISNDVNQLDYWVDVASVSGDERVFETFEDEAGEFTQQFLSETRVRGWGYDLGVTWWTSLPGSPEFTFAIAGTSKDSDPNDGTDDGYRQTGVHSNSADIGTASGLYYYGLVLAPELSNLQVRTAGVTFPLLSYSYVSFMFHDYQQISAATRLRNSSLDLTLTGASRNVGQALDVVVVFQESDKWTTSLSVGFFEPGKGVEQVGASAYYSYADLSYYF